jgi:S1-C subfamily serine protease
MPRWPALPAAAAAALALAACGGDGDNGNLATGETSSAPVAKEVRTTRVEVGEGLGAKGSFDPGALYRELSPGVVTIVSLFGGGALTTPGSDDRGEGGQGSGFLVDAQGHIATNAHVVTDGGGASAKRAKQVFVELSDGNRVAAKIVGTDPNADVALLKIDPSGLRVTPLALGRSAGLRVGQPVAAIGSPFGERQSLSVGVVSAVDRSIDSLTAFAIGGAIQTDAAINPGNSGGPLLDAKGRVIGINSQIKSRSGGGEGVGFAVPVDVVRRSLRELRADGKVEYGYLGVTSQQLYPQLADKLGVGVDQGALVVKIEKGSPADDAGLEVGDGKIDFQGQQDVPKGGDVIVGVGKRKVTQAADLADLVSRYSAGDEIELEVLRGGDRRTVKVELGERPNRAPNPLRP